MKQNTFTGNNSDFYNELKQSIKTADNIDIIVSFLMKSGIDIILDDLKDSNAKIGILTTDYLNITQPEALYTLKDKLPGAEIHFYSTKNTKASTQKPISSTMKRTQKSISDHQTFQEEHLQPQSNGTITSPNQKMKRISIAFKRTLKTFSKTIRLNLLMNN